MAEQVKPIAAPAHTATEIQVATTYLGIYRSFYNIPDLSDQGIIRMLIGYRNYLGTLPSASILSYSGSLAGLEAIGLV